MSDSCILVKCVLDSPNKLNLTGIWLDVKCREESIIVGIIDQLRVVNDYSFIWIFVVVFQPFDTHFEIQNESRRNFDCVGATLFLVAGVKAFTSKFIEDPHDFYQNVDKLENLGFFNFLFLLIFSDIVSHIEESHQLHLEFLMLQSKLNLHPFHRMRI